MSKEPTLTELRTNKKKQWELFLRCAWNVAQKAKNRRSAFVYFGLDDHDSESSPAVFEKLLGRSPRPTNGWTCDQVYALAVETFLRIEISGLLRIIGESTTSREVKKGVEKEVFRFLRDARKENSICQLVISDIKKRVESGNTSGFLINKNKKDVGQWSVALNESDREVSPLSEAEIRDAVDLLKSVQVQYPDAPQLERGATSRKSQRKPLRPTPEKGDNVLHPYSPKSCTAIVERLLERFEVVKRSDILKILEKLLPLWQKPALLNDESWVFQRNIERNINEREVRMISESEKVVDLASKPYFEAVTEEFLQSLKPMDLQLLPDVGEIGVSETAAGSYQIKAVELARRHGVEEDTMRKRIKALQGRVVSFFEDSDLDREDCATVLGLACDVLALRREASI